MEKTLTSETYRNIKAPWLVFGLFVVVGLSLLILYAVPGLPGRLGLPVLIISTSYKNPVFEFDFPDPSILQATDGWYYVYATQGITPEFEYQNIQLARSQDLVHWQRYQMLCQKSQYGRATPGIFGRLMSFITIAFTICITLQNPMKAPGYAWQSPQPRNLMVLSPIRENRLNVAQVLPTLTPSHSMTLKVERVIYIGGRTQLLSVFSNSPQSAYVFSQPLSQNLS